MVSVEAEESNSHVQMGIVVGSLYTDHELAQALINF